MVHRSKKLKQIQNYGQIIKENLTDRFIDLFVFEGGEAAGQTDNDPPRSILTMTPLEGILMAEYKSQAKGANFNTREASSQAMILLVV